MWAHLRILLTLAALVFASSAEARPFRGATPVFVILCQTSDAGTPPRTASQYRNQLFVEGQGGAADFWRDVSYHNFSNSGSSIHGWYQVSQTTAQFNALGRFERVNACLEAARTAPAAPVTLPSSALRYVVTWPSNDLFGWSGGAYLPWDFAIGDVIHEGGHGIGLDHSFSNDPNYRNVDWAAIGEYDDPWDAMSWANSFRTPTAFGDAPTGLIAPHLDRMGWLPRSRILVHGSRGELDATYTVAPINNPTTPGALLVRVPYDPADPFRYYTIEVMQQFGWATGIPATTVLIHDVRRNKDQNGAGVGSQLAWLQRNLAAPDRAPAQQISANGVTITVSRVNSATGQATVRVSSDMARRCVVGFVWREAAPSDFVCVPGAERDETREENRLGPSRRAGSGSFGPDTCIQGFVWREAFTGDRVCVESTSRTRARRSNELAVERANPARNVFGPNTCKPGFVWREADDFDWVCVEPGIRAQVRTDNTAAESRRAGGGPSGPNTCIAGYVWREAFPGDFVCVTGPTRTQTRLDNANAAARIVIP